MVIYIDMAYIEPGIESIAGLFIMLHTDRLVELLVALSLQLLNKITKLVQAR